MVFCFVIKERGHDIFFKLTAVPVASGQQKGSDKPPKIVDHLVSQYVKDGDPVVLQCRIIGSEKFDVVWLHNNKEIKPSKDFEYAHEANIYKLKINEIFPEDSGIYTCEAFNDAGESFSSCTLIVLGTLNNYHHSFTLTFFIAFPFYFIFFGSSSIRRSQRTDI